MSYLQEIVRLHHLSVTDAMRFDLAWKTEHQVNCYAYLMDSSADQDRPKLYDRIMDLQDRLLHDKAAIAYLIDTDCSEHYERAFRYEIDGSPCGNTRLRQISFPALAAKLQQDALTNQQSAQT